MVAKPARPSAAHELRGPLHVDPDITVGTGIAHAIYVKVESLFAVFSGRTPVDVGSSV
jgi:hypothetical protein